MSGKYTLNCYRPKEGHAAALDALVARHHAVLVAEGLATEQAAIVMKAGDGTVVELYQWSSREAVDAAHTNVALGVLWGEFAEISDFVPVGQLEEAQSIFSSFTRV